MFASTAEAASARMKAVSGSNVTQSAPNKEPKADNFTAKAAGLFFELGISPPFKCAPVFIESAGAPRLRCHFPVIRLRFSVKNGSNDPTDVKIIAITCRALQHTRLE